MRPPHALTALAVLLAVAAPAQAQNIVDVAPATVAEQYLLAAANQDRAALGLAPLHRDPTLVRAALTHARTMAAHQTISHQFPGEPDLSARGAAAGVRFSAISENVGEAPSAVTMHDLWMHSPGHRANLLDSTADSVGISVVARGGQLYAVEDFARSVRAMTLNDQESAVAALLAGPRLQVEWSAATTSAARETCAMSTGYAGATRPWFVMRFTADSLTALPAELQTRIASGRYRQAAVGACSPAAASPFTGYTIAVLLYP
jgi:uncharacterized protein YkwD